MKRKILYALKTGGIRLISLAVFAFLVFAAVWYQKGYYDFTFIERTQNTVLPDNGEEAEQPKPQNPPENQNREPEETEDTAADTEETPETKEPSSPVPVVKETAKTVLAGLKTVKDARAAGYSAQSGGTFARSSWCFADKNITGLPKTYSTSTYQRRALLTTEYDRGCIYTEETTEEAARPAVMLKNGYIIRDNGNGKLSLLRFDGSTVMKEYDETTFYLTNLRDQDGNPLFAAPKTVKQKVFLPIYAPNEFTGRMEETGFFEEEETEIDVTVNTYYYLTPENQWMVSKYTDENPQKDADFGLCFDMPADFGVSDCDLERYFDYSRYGYRSKKTGQTVIYPRYKMAYNFHDGYAVCFDDYNMYVINEKGTAVYAAAYDMPETFATFNELTLPDTNGIESIGTYYFSHGLTRVRYRRNLVTYQTYYYIKSDDYSALIDTEGKEFPIPAGYILEGYSDGVLLLKKQDEDVWGYLNYKGAWIVQPEYTYARPFLSGLAVVGDKNGKKGIVDTDGKWVLAPVFDEISDISSGCFAVYEKSVGWHILQCMAK